MLAIALIPSAVLLAAGVGLNTYLLVSAVQQRDTAELLSTGYSMAVPFMPALSEERAASIAEAADPTPQNRAALTQSRNGMNQLLAQFSGISTQVANAMPTDARDSIGRFVASMPGIFTIRQQIDNGTASALQVYQAYNQVADAMILAADAIGEDSTTRDVALERTDASELMRISDWLDRSNALAAAAYQVGGMTADEADQYDQLTRAYRAELAAMAPTLPAQEQNTISQLESSAQWNELGAVETTLVHSSFYPSVDVLPTLPVSVARWQDDARYSGTVLSTVGLGDLGSDAAAQEKSAADAALTRSIVIAVVSLVLAIGVLVVAVRMGTELVARLRRLRVDTLDADRRLPEVVDRIRNGDPVDTATEIPELDYGPDEIGEVAGAFSKAQRSAVLAAVQEARLRRGTNVVFLNIARRSQALVKRQLQVLDQAQRSADDPDQVALLFQLDHLSTRERRNAENLIVLGGGELARQWHSAVRLIDLVRGAAAETEQYQRVTFKRIPNMLVAGHAVADLVHLLAELVDNAIEFSQRDSRIEVSSNAVGHGAVVEIDDQGIGISGADRDRYNTLFQDPPDFSVMALSEDTRIGFFVVARLAHRHGIRVSLLESPYGGLRAVVLIPRKLITFDETAPSEGTGPADSWFDRVEQHTEQTVQPVAAEPIAELTAAHGTEFSIEHGAAYSAEYSVEHGAEHALELSADPATHRTTVFFAPDGTATVASNGSAGSNGSNGSNGLAGDAANGPADWPGNGQLAGDPLPVEAGPRHLSHELDAVLDGPADQPPGPDFGARPGYPVTSVEESWPQWPRAESADEQRPPLPRRQRQSHLAPQLREDPEQVVPVFAGDDLGTGDEADAAALRHMMTAFQRGTERGRSTGEPWDPRHG